MYKNIRISNLVYEMLVEVSKKARPQTKPEALVERLIKDEYSHLKSENVLHRRKNINR